MQRRKIIVPKSVMHALSCRVAVTIVGGLRISSLMGRKNDVVHCERQYVKPAGIAPESGASFKILDDEVVT